MSVASTRAPSSSVSCPRCPAAPARASATVNAPRAHPHGDAPPETAVFVGAARQPTRPRDLLGERLEGALVRLRRHDNALRVSRLALTSSCLGLISSALRHSCAASSRSFRLYAMLPSLNYTSSPRSGASSTARL